MIGASMTNSVRARAALAIVRLMDELAFDPDQLRDRRGRWVKDPRSGARPSAGGGAGAGGSSAVKRSPSPRDFGNFTPTNDALWAQRQERLGKRTPAATPADIKRGAVIPMDGGRWAKVMQDPYTTARKRGSVQILEDGASYARDYSVSSASEAVRRDAAERAWREAGGTREAFDRERDSALTTPAAPPDEPHLVDERAESRALQLAEIDRDVAIGRRRDATQTRIDRAEIAIRRHADAVKMHENEPDDQRWTDELREAEADLTRQGVKVESYGYTQPGHDGGTARYNAMGQLDARAGREAELDARPGATGPDGSPQAVKAALSAWSDGVKDKYPGVKLDVYQTGSGFGILSRIEVPKELRGKGLGEQILSELIAIADQHGIPLAATPSGDYGGSVTKLRAWYKRHGFLPNKGKNRDYGTQEELIRPARVAK